MVTARDGVSDRIAGLDAGGDDYLVKPYDFGELLSADARAAVRRGAAAASRTRSACGRPHAAAAHGRGELRGRARKPLTPKEFGVLEYPATARR